MTVAPNLMANYQGINSCKQLSSLTIDKEFSPLVENSKINN